MRNAVLLVETNWFYEQPESARDNTPATTQNTVPKIQQVGDHVLAEQLIVELFMHNNIYRFTGGPFPTIRLHIIDIAETVFSANVLGKTDDIGMV